MVGIGMAMAALALASGFFWWKNRALPHGPIIPAWLLRGWVASVPLGYLATECGWIVREVGRQPWAVYGLLRTEHAASHLPAPAVVTSLVLFAVIYSLLLLTFIVFARRIILTGPDVHQPLPSLQLPIPAHK
jgi:cytochrome d ubiquinol oxidase subunit I